MFREFLSELKQINTLTTKEYSILLFFFLISSLFDLIGLSLIGPYVQSFFFDDVASNSNLTIFLKSLFSNPENFFLFSTFSLVIVFLCKGFLVSMLLNKSYYFHQFNKQN